MEVPVPFLLLPKAGVEGAGRLYPLLDIEADLPEVVYQPGADDLVGLVDTAIVQHVGFAQIDAGLLEQLPGFGAGFLDVRPVARQLLELLLRRRQRMAREGDAADRLDRKSTRLNSSH